MFLVYTFYIFLLFYFICSLIPCRRHYINKSVICSVTGQYSLNVFLDMRIGLPFFLLKVLHFWQKKRKKNRKEKRKSNCLSFTLCMRLFISFKIYTWFLNVKFFINFTYRLDNLLFVLEFHCRTESIFASLKKINIFKNNIVIHGA